MTNNRRNQDFGFFSGQNGVDSSSNAIKPELAFENIYEGALVKFKVEGVDDNFIELSGVFCGMAKQGAVFSNLSGVPIVKQKFYPETPIVVIFGNRAYLSEVVSLDGKKLIINGLPSKVVESEDRRKEERYECSISSLIQIEQRGVTSYKRVTISDISYSGCKVSMTPTKDEIATGLLVEKEITINIDFKKTKKSVKLQGQIKNVRKNTFSEIEKSAGVSFTALSHEASRIIEVIIDSLQNDVKMDAA